jgi:hypothetical protein
MAGFLDILNAVGPYVSAGGQIAGAVGANRAAGRGTEAGLLQTQDRAAIDRYRTEQEAKVAAAALAERAAEDRADRFKTAAMDRARQVGIGEALQNLKPVTLSGLPSYIPHMQFQGGLTAGALGPLSRQAGGNLAQMALQAQLQGSDVPDMPNLSGLGANAPGLSDLPQAGKLDSFLNILSTIGLISKAGQQAQKEAGQTDEDRRLAAARKNPANYDPTVLSRGISFAPTTRLT